MTAATTATRRDQHHHRRPRHDDHGGDRDDDATSTTIDDHGNDDRGDDASVGASPAPFTETYGSAGGSVTVSWSGTALGLVSVSPAGGYRADVEEAAWDRIRVDFDGADDSRIEVRLHDGRIQVRVD